MLPLVPHFGPATRRQRPVWPRFRTRTGLVTLVATNRPGPEFAAGVTANTGWPCVAVGHPHLYSGSVRRGLRASNRGADTGNQPDPAEQAEPAEAGSPEPDQSVSTSATSEDGSAAESGELPVT